MSQTTDVMPRSPASKRTALRRGGEGTDLATNRTSSNGRRRGAAIDSRVGGSRAYVHGRSIRSPSSPVRRDERCSVRPCVRTNADRRERSGASGDRRPEPAKSRDPSGSGGERRVFAVSSGYSWLGTRESIVGVSRCSSTEWNFACTSARSRGDRGDAGCALNARPPRRDRSRGRGTPSPRVSSAREIPGRECAHVLAVPSSREDRTRPSSSRRRRYADAAASNVSNLSSAVPRHLASTRAHRPSRVARVFLENGVFGALFSASCLLLSLLPLRLSVSPFFFFLERNIAQRPLHFLSALALSPIRASEISRLRPLSRRLKNLRYSRDGGIQRVIFFSVGRSAVAVVEY